MKGNHKLLPNRAERMKSNLDASSDQSRHLHPAPRAYTHAGGVLRRWRRALQAGLLLHVLAACPRWALADTPAVIYVDVAQSASAHTGADWAHAYNNLQEALDEADGNVNTVVVMATGVYKPSDRTGFHITNPNSLLLAGGFKTQGKASPAGTTLSGDLNNNNISDSGDAYNILTINSGDTGVITMQNLTFQDAYNDSGSPFGGAIYAQHNASLSLSNCIFLDNTVVLNGAPVNDTPTFGGGAIYDANFGSLSVANCSFTHNLSDPGQYKIYGGALFLDGERTGNLNITGSTFVNNQTGDRGGAIFGDYLNTISISSATFTGNAARWAGGALSANLSYSDSFLGQVINISNSAFQNNSCVQSQGGAAELAALSVEVSGTSFAANSANEGGALTVENSNTHIQTCLFDSNVAHTFSSAVRLLHGSGLVEQSVFQNNSDLGGQTAALTMDEGQLTADKDSFLNNRGAGLQTWQATTLTLSRSSFDGNQRGAIDIESQAGADGDVYSINNNTFKNSVKGATDRMTGGNGGVLFFAGQHHDQLSIAGNTFTSSSSTGNGGALCLNGGIATVQNNAFSANQAGGSGGALYFDYSTALTVMNNTFASDSAANSGGAIWGERLDANIAISYNTFSKQNTAVRGAQIYINDLAVLFSAGTPGMVNGQIDPAAAETALVGQSHNNGLTQVNVLIDSTVVRLYVAPLGSGDGSSWANAETLEQALASIVPGQKTEIWMEAGTYTPSATLAVPGDTAIFGGFIGTESTLAARTFASSTIIDGAGTSAGIFAMNVLGRFYVVDGVTMQRGNKSSGHGGAINANNVHLGLYNDTFLNNATPTGWGGAVFVGGGWLRINNSVFQDNEGDRGGAVTLYSTYQSTIMNSTFNNNYGAERAGAVFSFYNGVVNISNNVFTANYGLIVGAVYSAFDQFSGVTGNRFVDNGTGEVGGALGVNGVANCVATGNLFQNNSAPFGTFFGGAAMWVNGPGNSFIGGSTADLKNTFSGNSSLSILVEDLFQYGALDSLNSFAYVPGSTDVINSLVTDNVGLLNSDIALR